MSDDRPIIEFPNPSHAQVVDLAGFRIARGKASEPPACAHNSIIVDDDERRAYCHDCRSEVDAFTVLVKMRDHWASMSEAIDDRKTKVEEYVQNARSLQADVLRRRVAKHLDHTWSSKGGCPCPHCDIVLLAQDFEGKMSWHNALIEIERRERERAGAFHAAPE